MPLQEVLTRFGFEFDKSKLTMMESGIKRTQTHLNTAAAATQKFQQTIGTAMTRVVQMAGAYVGFRAIKGMTSDYANAADASAKFAKAASVSTEAYQGMAYAVQINGAEVENLNKALPQLSKRAGEAADGNKTYAREFDRLGVSVKDANGNLKTSDQLFLEIADGMKALKDPQRKTQVAMTLLGRTGATLIPTFNEGSEGIKKLIEEGKKLGAVMTPKQLKAAEDYKDAMLRLKTVFTGLRNALASQIIPSITAVAERFTKWYREGNNSERMLRWLRVAAMLTGAVVASMITGFVLKQMQGFISGIKAAIVAVRSLGIAGMIAAAKLWLLIGAFALVAAIIEDLVAFAQGRDSVIGRILGDTSQADALRKGLLAFWDELKLAWNTIVPELKRAWKELSPVLGELYTTLKPVLGWLMRVSLDGFIATVKGVGIAVKVTTSAFKFWLDMIKSVVSAIENMLAAVTKVSSLMGGPRKLLNRVTGSLGLGNVLGGSSSSRGGDKWGTDEPDSSARPAPPPGVWGPSAGAAPALPGASASGVPYAVQHIISQPTVASGAVQVTVNAKGDAAQIAAQIQPHIKRGFVQLVTSTSRDLVRPPAGQR